MNTSIRISTGACINPRELIGLALPATLALACSNGDVNLGGGLVAQDLETGSRCAESARLEGDVTVENQSQLEELAGCEAIGGDLIIQLFQGADLAPLASLRAVDGALFLGAPRPFESEDPEEQFAYQQERQLGYLDSLHGLEALESVGSLQVMSVRIEDFTELTSLSRIDEGLGIYTAPNLERLTGLERPSLRNLSIISSPALETLEGVTLAEPLDVFQISDVLSLTNIDVFAGISVCNEMVEISSTGLERLPELALVRTNYLSLDNNPALLDASGLASLSAVTELAIGANPLLREFPALPNLRYVEFLTIVSNGIETLALDFPALEPNEHFFGGRNVALSATMVDIGYNPNLTSITAPAIFPAVQYLNIGHNDVLTSVDFGTLERADLLSLVENPVLASVTPGALATVDRLELSNNPSLDPAAFDAVRTFDTVITEGEAAAPDAANPEPESP